jgi:putative ABC transport system permease protein
MRLISFLLLRGWSGHRLRTSLTILGVALGVAIVAAIQVMDHNTVQSRLHDGRAMSGAADFELLPMDPQRSPKEVRERLASDPEIAAVHVLHRTPIAAITNAASGELGSDAILFGVAPLGVELGAPYALARGDDLSDLDSPDAVLIGEELARDLGVEPGDSIELGLASARAVVRCENGVRVEEHPPESPRLRRPVVVRGVLAGRLLGGREAGRVVVSGFGLAQAIAPRSTTVFRVERREGSDLDAMRARLSAEFLVRDERSALLGESADERAYRNGVKLLGGLALMLGMFVVFQTLSQSLVERLRTIGILRALGAGNLTIGGVFLLDAVVMAGVGVVLGIVLGLGLAWTLQQFRISTLGMLHDWQFHEIPWASLGLIALLGLCFTLAGAVFPLVRARSLSAVRILHARGLGGQVDVLRGVNVFLFVMLVLVVPVGYLATTTLLSDSERESRIVLLQLAGLLLAFGALLLLTPALVRVPARWLLAPARWIAPLPAHLATKTFARQSGRIAASVCGLGVVLLAAIALESLTTALHGDARRFHADAMDHAIFVRGSGASRERLARIEELDSVRAVDPLIGPVFPGLQLFGADVTMLERTGGPFAGRPGEVARYGATRSLVVSERLARLMDLRVGSAVALRTDTGPVAYTVLGISDKAGFFPDEPAWALAHPRWLAQDFCLDDQSIERAILWREPGSNALQVLRDARAIVPFAFAKRGEEVLAYLLNDVTRDFRLFQILLGLILVLAAAGVVNAMSIAAMGRVHEIGVLRALGASNGQIRSAFVLEGAVTGVLAAALALGLGVPMGRLVVSGMNEVAGLNAPYAVPTHVLTLIPVLAIGVGILAALVPSWRALRIRTEDAVRFAG